MTSAFLTRTLPWLSKQDQLLTYLRDSSVTVEVRPDGWRLPNQVVYLPEKNIVRSPYHIEHFSPLEPTRRKAELIRKFVEARG
jgi:hypothetical protein